MALVAPKGCLCEESAGGAVDFGIFVGDLEGALGLSWVLARAERGVLAAPIASPPTVQCRGVGGSGELNGRGPGCTAHRRLHPSGLVKGSRH